MPDMNDPRIAMMRDRMMQMRGQQDQMAGQFQGGLALPEQLPAGPVDTRMQMPIIDRSGADARRAEFLANNPRPPMNQMPQRQLPPQAMGQPQGQPFQPQSMQKPMGTPAQMPMANTMNPNANSARPSMRNNMMQRRGQMMGQMGRRQAMGQRQQQSPTPGAELAPPRSVTPF